MMEAASLSTKLKLKYVFIVHNEVNTINLIDTFIPYNYAFAAKCHEDHRSKPNVSVNLISSILLSVMTAWLTDSVEFRQRQ